MVCDECYVRMTRLADGRYRCDMCGRTSTTIGGATRRAASTDPTVNAINTVIESSKPGTGGDWRIRLLAQGTEPRRPTSQPLPARDNGSPISVPSMPSCEGSKPSSPPPPDKSKASTIAPKKAGWLRRLLDVLFG